MARSALQSGPPSTPGICASCRVALCPGAPGEAPYGSLARLVTPGAPPATSTEPGADVVRTHPPPPPPPGPCRSSGKLVVGWVRMPHASVPRAPRARAVTPDRLPVAAAITIVPPAPPPPPPSFSGAIALRSVRRDRARARDRSGADQDDSAAGAAAAGAEGAVVAAPRAAAATHDDAVDRRRDGVPADAPVRVVRVPGVASLAPDAAVPAAPAAGVLAVSPVRDPVGSSSSRVAGGAASHAAVGVAVEARVGDPGRIPRPVERIEQDLRRSGGALGLRAVGAGRVGRAVVGVGAGAAAVRSPAAPAESPPGDVDRIARGGERARGRESADTRRCPRAGPPRWTRWST